MKSTIFRLYNTSDSILIHTLYLKLNFAERDESEFANYGFNAADRLAIEAASDAFLYFPDDIEFLANYMEAIEEKNKIRKELKAMTRQMMQRVANRYGRHTARYRKYRTKGMNKMTDLSFEVMGSWVARCLRNDLSELASGGLTLVMVNAYKELANSFVTSTATVYDKKADRAIAAEDRVIMGNALFKQFVQLCNTGKVIWEERSEARYNDYLWHKKFVK